jgi:hypothetical protein
VLALGGAAAAQEPPAAPTHRLGNLLYAIPEGYVAAGGPDGVMLARRDEIEAGRITGLIVLPRELRPDAATAARIAAAGQPASAQAIALAAGNLTADPAARFSPAEPINDAARDGFAAYRVVTIGADPAAGDTRYSVVVVAFPGEFVHVLAASGFGSEAALAAVLPGFEALLASGGFRNMGTPDPAVEPPPLPATLAELMPRAPAATGVGGGGGGGVGGGGGCRTVQRQMCSGGFASGMGYFCNTYPETVCD